ncbi:MAG TPA: adenylate/guanylate cyclase domain-containing protein [Terriglobales bacterium]|nr:adenylate/guanylate cyclase domain-containing protein [Terriglobales bacterium]
MTEPSLAPFLKFQEGDGREIPLIAGNVWKIGRGEQNAVVLIDGIVSRNHAMIQQLEGGEFYLIDMGSSNGSFLNGRRLAAPAALRDGDILSFGKSRLCFRNLAQATARVTALDSPLKQATISVLVVEIRGLAALAREVDPRVLNKLVRTWFAEVDRTARHYGSTAERHIGDAVMTIWTHGAKGQEHIEVLRILRAVAKIAEVTATLYESFGLAAPLRIRAGLNTGVAAIGKAGAGAASDFTAIGDSVDAAFRMKSAAKALETDLVLAIPTFDYLRMWGAVRHFRSSEATRQGSAAQDKFWSTSFALLSEFLAEHRGELIKTTTGRTYPAVTGQAVRASWAEAR